ncbi:RNA polymerase sigma factor [Hoylesella shahii]|uniref:RNA polymerase sigma-70 factor (ECF subfamily) n=1 Tax=Hoylesella shahii DSM 15611 = JCM 12083 TaxID=1122991 RepID=A0A318HUV6_9BACT|nr:sigma-70 family RNA polymerase sigma factor [Hoylesella shahii]PXX22325.1 RNA polymerase sigma-70 factor (ECF subfamily) [Hoylesella shahii DSM 15611 = JCM 12083]
MTVDEYKEEVERNRPRMLSVARSYLKASEEAEDVVQDVLLKLWQLLDKLRIPMGPLALVLVRNRCIDCLRRLQTTIDIPENVAESEPTCDERYEKAMQLVDKLSTMQQTIMRLRHMEGMEMCEIAALTGSNETAVRKALSRARQAIRQQLKQQSNE